MKSHIIQICDRLRLRGRGTTDMKARRVIPCHRRVPYRAQHTRGNARLKRIRIGDPAQPPAGKVEWPDRVEVYVRIRRVRRGHQWRLPL